LHGSAGQSASAFDASLANDRFTWRSPGGLLAIVISSGHDEVAR
jgi:hypothetical protein